MPKAIMTVMRSDQPLGLDLEVPVNLAASHLAMLLATVLYRDSRPEDQPAALSLEHLPPGKILDPGETLESVNAWDGSWLVLHGSDDG